MKGRAVVQCAGGVVTQVTGAGLSDQVVVVVVVVVGTSHAPHSPAPTDAECQRSRAGHSADIRYTMAAGGGMRDR